MKMEVSAIKLRNSYQIYYVDTNNLFVNQNSTCVVEIDHGVDIGNVIKCKKYKNIPKTEIKGKILRILSEKDSGQIRDIENIEKKAYKVCKEKAKNKKLEMKLISVKCLFDKTKIIFYFVAENRIDFRELVRELASVFRTRIEMRQIGVRDEARLVGGYGPCGRIHCCVHNRQEFDPVSIKMAKEQNLNLNSLKISGMCGRLLCCLGYEYSVYKDLNKLLPKVGSEIHSKDIKFIVRSVDVLKETIRLADGNRFFEISNNDLIKAGGKISVKDEVIEKLNQPDDDLIENS